MTMRWLIGLVLVFSLTAGVFAQEANSITQSVDPKQQEVKVLPMPANLSPGWWNYFAVTGEELTKRTEEAQRQYTSLVNQLESEQRVKAEQYVERLLGNLRILQELSVTDSKQFQDAGHESFKEKYSIDEWLAFATHLQSERIDVDNQTVRLDRERSEVKSARKRINNMMLSYMESAGDEHEKLMLGLEMMAKRSVNAIKEAQLKLDKQALDLQREQLNGLLSFNEGIAARLFTDKEFLQQIEQSLTQLEKEQAHLTKRLNAAQSETIGLLGKDPKQRAKARLKDQKVINALIEEAIAKIKIASLTAQYDLATLILEPEQKKLRALLDRNQKVLQLSDELKKKVIEWLMNTTNEISQVQTSIMALPPENHNGDLGKIYQSRVELTQRALVALKQFELEREKLTILTNEIDNRVTQQAGKWGTVVNWSSTKIEDLKSNIVSWWTQPLFEIGDTPVSAFGLLRVLLIIGIASLISSGLRRLLLRIADRKNKNGGSAAGLYTIGRLAHYVILFIGIVVALSSIGLDFTNLALVAGALSVGIGFGLQSVVNNFVSGLILLFEGTLKIGDFIEIESGAVGIVKEINVRSTLINTNDNVDIIVPNSVLVSNKVTNWTLREANRRIHVPFGVAYGTDKELVKKAVLEAASRVRYTHKSRRGEAVQCWLVSFGDSSLNFELVVWINNEAVVRPSTVHAAYMWEIETSLNQYGIQIPFPQRDLHIRSVFGETDTVKT